ncbi:hypothetical protein BJY16_007528 [Actinoplanes octamycinicus]|uniref:Uncharacterized protein n=1 Tax=Actinoplanes octamycinicus TaxID=135948 RepID=A0A7W7H507_9ACTN|nr:hypothetical protein [Actinoplanes octamycinicus]MBB4744069.1 hypothetical protein [Actinoplanes octamycinicus]GIE56974.1 hypothetical protein Aoc01nite_23760 [Actinoplanes octamycinicus]
MADEIKRVHYFDHQFLRETDFTAEQEYHLEQRRRHQRLQHTWGIAEGLTLTTVAGGSRVTVTAGAAVDGNGRELVLPHNAQTADLSGSGGQTLFVTLAYDEQQTDSTSETGVTGNTRWTELPVVDVSPDPPDDPSLTLILGRATVANDGTISGVDDGDGPNRRRAAGVVGGDLEVHDLALTDPQVAPSQWVRLRLGAAGRADLQGNLQVSGTVDGRDVSADGTRLDQHVANTANPHGTTAAQLGALTSVGGVSNPGGDISLAGANTISVVTDDGNNAIIVGETHSTDGNNPHATTADQVGALPITGGQVSGPVRVLGALSVDGDTMDVTVSTARGLAGLQVQMNLNAGQPAQNAIQGIVAGTGGIAMPAERSAVMGLSNSTRAHGGYFGAPNGAFALIVNGAISFNGGKPGYVTDLFVNASPGRLRTGDVVKLAGTGSTSFSGTLNRIPVNEVLPADTADDPLVIGIMDGEVLPAPGEPDQRTEPDDPTFVAPGGRLHVVTLGCYAHCRADATEAPIRVGDLLTSSANPGHAKKATEPKLGTIIGKALEPLAEGTGYIAVFVNIQ